MGDEAALLERARTLRAKIEDPTRPDPGGEEAAGPERTVTDEVQGALLAAQPGSPARRELLDWVRPGLLAATAAFAESAQVAVSTDVTLRTDAGLIEVSEDGAQPERLQRAEASIAEARTWPITQLVVPAAVAVVAAFLALLTAVNDHPRGALLLVLVAVIAIALALNALRLRRREDGRRRELVAALHAQVADGRRAAGTARQAQQQVMLDAAALAATLTTRLQTPARPADVETAPI